MIGPQSALYKDMQAWLDPVTDLPMASPTGGKDNEVLYAAYLYRELNRINAGTDALTVMHNASDFLKACLVVPGLYKRSPRDPGPNSVDNLIGTCYLNKWAAADILTRWNKRFACFDVARPNWIGIGANWYGRFLGLKVYIKACAGRELNWFDKLTWSIACLWSTYRSSGASDPLLQSLQNDAVPGCEFAKRQWGKRYQVKALYAEYFGSDTPLAKY